MSVFILPLALLCVSGEAEHYFDGESDYERPPFSVSAFFDRHFQTGFENWFSTRYPLRPAVVEFYGKIGAKKYYNAANAEVSYNAHTLYSEIEPKFPEYLLAADEIYDPGGYRGTAQVVVGMNGYMYENGYINEFLGFSKKYFIDDMFLKTKAGELKSIQERLAERGVAFLVLITPSKASSLPQFIPPWYTARFEPDPGYIRPYDMFLTLLDEYKINFIDSKTLFASLGLTNTFPKTGTHWTKFAALEAAAAAISAYGNQTGRKTRNLTAAGVFSGKEPPGFGTSETDIFGVAYAGKRGELEYAVTDELYYWPDVQTVDADAGAIGHIFIQGGSFTDDLAYYYTTYGISKNITNIRYNIGGDPEFADWDLEINKTDFCILEVNEQFVYNMGGNAPSFGQNDFMNVSRGANIVESLYTYLNKR